MLGIFLAASTSVSLLSLSHHFPVVEQCVYSQLVPGLVSSDKNPKHEVLNVTEGSHLTVAGGTASPSGRQAPSTRLL